MQLLKIDGDTTRPLSVLCIGSHPDDIEIGAGATLLTWLAQSRPISVHWCVFSGDTTRIQEARDSAMEWLAGAANATVEVLGFPDAHFPSSVREIKEAMERIRNTINPDVVFTHSRDDAHQDHRTLSEATWGSFRDHLILEYEIPKWDGDLGRPNCYAAVDGQTLEKKIQLLGRHFASQREKPWFDEETFRGLARLRGLECRARYAEAFVVRKFGLSV